MSEISQQFFAWCNGYRDWLITPKASTPIDGMKHELAWHSFCESLRPIMLEMATELEIRGIDPTACHELRSRIATADFTESQLDAVWSLASRLRSVTPAPVLARNVDIAKAIVDPEGGNPDPSLVSQWTKDPTYPPPLAGNRSKKRDLDACLKWIELKTKYCRQEKNEPRS